MAVRDDKERSGRHQKKRIVGNERVRENPFYVSESGVSSEHIGNRFPAIPRIAQSLKTKKMSTRTSRKLNIAEIEA